MKRLVWFVWFIFELSTGMVGHTIHGSLFWSIVDFLFAPLAWGKWLVCHQVSLSIVKHTFAFITQ